MSAKYKHNKQTETMCRVITFELDYESQKLIKRLSAFCIVLHNTIRHHESRSLRFVLFPSTFNDM